MTTPALFVVGSFVVSCSAHVARMPRAGESLAATLATIEAGGKGFNLAVAARRLGCTVDGVLAVGNDSGAALAERAVALAGLPATMLLPLEGPTGTGVCFVDAAGETRVAIAAGANLALSGDHLRDRAAAISRADFVLAQFETGDAAVAAAFTAARRAGVPTLLNPSPFRAIPPEILSRTTILVVNETEAAALLREFGLDPSFVHRPAAFAAHAAPAITTAGPDIVVLTRGAEGAVAFPRHGAPVVEAGFRVTTVDALGAGDAFAAALTVGLASGHRLDQALRGAAAAGALATTRRGVFDALPAASDISALIHHNSVR